MFENSSGTIKIFLPSFPNISAVFRSLYLIFGYLELGRKIEIVGRPLFSDSALHVGSLASSEFSQSMFRDLYIETVSRHGCDFCNPEIDAKTLSISQQFTLFFDFSIVFNADVDIAVVRASGSSLLGYFLSQIKKSSTIFWKIRFLVLFIRSVLIFRPTGRGRLYASHFDCLAVDKLRKDIENFFQKGLDPIVAIALNIDLRGEVEPYGRRLFGPKLIGDVNGKKKDEEIFRLVSQCSKVKNIILVSKKSFDVDLIAPQALMFDLREPEVFGITHAQAVCLIQEFCQEFMSWPSTYCSFIASSDALVSKVFYDGKDGF